MFYANSSFNHWALKINLSSYWKSFIFNIKLLKWVNHPFKKFYRYDLVKGIPWKQL